MESASAPIAGLAPEGIVDVYQAGHVTTLSIRGGSAVAHGA
jgi:hypothetical protein